MLKRANPSRTWTVAVVFAFLCGAGATGAAATAGGPTVRSGWPCSGCIVEVPAGHRADKPVPLLVLLHGDEGAPGHIAASLAPFALPHNVIVFAPQCPTARGCRVANSAGGFTNSWWYWLQSSGRYDDAWLGSQIERVESSYPVDRRRIYLLGWSGGADFLGWYALQHSSSFAAAAFVAGGVPYHLSCPQTHLAGYFLLGAADPRYQTGQPIAVRSILARCADPTKVVVIPGADHVGTIAALTAARWASRIVDWLLAHHSAG
jgi:poly(3-hydroxybutyrate) depolymerase